MTFATQIDKQLVQDLLNAIENDQTDQARSLLDELTQLRESELYQQLNQLTQNLHHTLDDLDCDAPVLLHTKHDLPDVTERLQYVIEETQKASEQTLTSTEAVLGLLDQVSQILSNDSSTEALTLAKTTIDQACSELTNIMMAQSFQDLTGQVLNRVIYVMTDLEESLKALIERSKFDYHAIPERVQTDEQRRAEEARGLGPNVTDKSKQDTVSSQDDVDDLLSDLGI
ncbi:MAG: protein phosphatase CheZ [Pseudomonadota bacterium]|nr:protein phosphatase CheZ [Pseudomonadota bacterium]